MEQANREIPKKAKATLAFRIAGRLSAVALLGLLLIYFRPVLVPLVFALLLAFLLKPLVNLLTARKIPTPVAILLAEGVATLPVGVLALVFLSSAGPLTEQLPKYQTQLVVQADQTLNAALSFVGKEEQRARIRNEVVENLLPQALNGGATFVKESIGAVTSALGMFLLTLVLSAFVLFEAGRFREKVS